MPTIGRASASSDRPIALTKALRRKSEKSASPYDVRPFFIPFGAVMRIIIRWRVRATEHAEKRLSS